MQITALGAKNLHQRCEDYENTFARMESDCTLRFGLKAIIKVFRTVNSQICFCISWALWNALADPEASSRARSCSVWQWRRIVVYVLLHDDVNVRVSNIHNPYRTGHIENYKQSTADLHLVALFLWNLVLVQFFGSQTKARWWCVLLGSDPLVVFSQYLLRFRL